MLGCEGTLHKVPLDDLLWFPDRSQAQAGGPAKKLAKVGNKLVISPLRHASDTGLVKRLLNLVFNRVDHALVAPQGGAQERAASRNAVKSAREAALFS